MCPLASRPERGWSTGPGRGYPTPGDSACGPEPQANVRVMFDPDGHPFCPCREIDYVRCLTAGHNGWVAPINSYVTRPLNADTWADFARLVEANNGVWGGCWCMGFHPEGVGKGHTAARTATPSKPT